MNEQPRNNQNSRPLGNAPKTEDYALLADSFITKDIANLAGIGRVDDLQGANTVGREPNANTSYEGLVFPHYLPPNYAHPREYTLRRDQPDMVKNSNGEFQEKGKYLGPPGARNILGFPPGVTGEMFQDKKLPIVVLEGFKKLLSMYRVATAGGADEKWHFLPIALSGVWNFRGTVGKTDSANGRKVTVKGEIPDLDLISWKGRTVTILFDANVRTNPSVNAARATLASVLKKRGARVLFADLPEDCEVNGIDDHLGRIDKEYGAQAAIEAALRILENAQRPTKTVNPTPANFRLDKDGDNPGVYFIDGIAAPFFICSHLEITAETFNLDGESYGRFLEWEDSEGRRKSFAMPIQMVHGDASELVRYLSSLGLKIGTSPRHYSLLRAYINYSEPEETILCTDRTGWYGETYVLPNEHFGKGPKVTVQGAANRANKFQTRGGLEDWRENISRYCVGNSRLGFAVSAAFASTLLPFLNVQGGGFHFYGSTSIGKTTAALVGGSVFGGSSEALGYCETWRATDNALEAVCQGHNHALLCLDEIGQCDPKKIGEIAYMIANGRGKSRMDADAVAKRSASWQLFFLSNGEKKLSQLIGEAGQTVKGGQLVRCCDIDADTGVKGIFENLHDFASGQALADHLRAASAQYFGTPIREFLTQLLQEGRDHTVEKWAAARASIEQRFLRLNSNAPSEVRRVAGLFAAVAFGGEIATQLGVTGWPEGEATRAVAEVFASWMVGRSGPGAADEENAVRQVRHFLEVNGQSRFQSFEDAGAEIERVFNRAGFKKMDRSNGSSLFCIFPEVFREEVCKGYNPTLVAAALKKRGFLITDNGKNQKTERLPGIGKNTKVYAISSAIFESEPTPDADVDDAPSLSFRRAAG